MTRTSWMQGDNSLGSLRRESRATKVEPVSEYDKKRSNILSDLESGCITQKQASDELKELKRMNETEKQDDLLRVVGVAIKEKNGRIYQLPKPNRHHHVIKEMVKDGCTTPIAGEQGFILSDGRFAGRIVAKFVAEKSGQLLDRASKRCELFSECIW